MTPKTSNPLAPMPEFIAAQIAAFVRLDYLPEGDGARVVIAPRNPEARPVVLFEGGDAEARLYLARQSVRFPQLANNLPKPGAERWPSDTKRRGAVSPSSR